LLSSFTGWSGSETRKPITWTICILSEVLIPRSTKGVASWAALAAIIHKFGMSVDFLRKFKAESVFRCNYKASKLVEPNGDEARAHSGDSSAGRELSEEN